MFEDLQLHRYQYCGCHLICDDSMSTKLQADPSAFWSHLLCYVVQHEAVAVSSFFLSLFKFLVVIDQIHPYAIDVSDFCQSFSAVLPELSDYRRPARVSSPTRHLLSSFAAAISAFTLVQYKVIGIKRNEGKRPKL